MFAGSSVFVLARGLYMTMVKVQGAVGGLEHVRANAKDGVECIGRCHLPGSDEFNYDLVQVELHEAGEVCRSPESVDVGEDWVRGVFVREGVLVHPVVMHIFWRWNLRLLLVEWILRHLVRG